MFAGLPNHSALLTMLVLIIFAVVELFFNSLVVLLWESLSAVLLVSVLFRLHEGVNTVSDFLLRVSGDSASCSVGEIIPFRELYGPLISSKYLGCLSTRVFETRTVTESELISLLTYPLTTTFTLLSIFSPLKVSSRKIW